MGLDKLLWSLMTHEITIKSNEKVDESKKKREIALKTSSSQTNEAINDDEKSDEEITLFTRRFNKMFKKGKFSQRQGKRNFEKRKGAKEGPYNLLQVQEAESHKS